MKDLHDDQRTSQIIDVSLDSLSLQQEVAQAGLIKGAGVEDVLEGEACGGDASHCRGDDDDPQEGALPQRHGAAE